MSKKRLIRFPSTQDKDNKQPVSLEKLILPQSEFSITAPMPSRQIRSISQSNPNSTTNSLKLPPKINPQVAVQQKDSQSITIATQNQYAPFPIKKIRIKQQPAYQKKIQLTEKTLQRNIQKVPAPLPPKPKQQIIIKKVEQKQKPRQIVSPVQFVQQVQQLLPCKQGCGRKFKKQALQKHQKACKIVFQSKRKQFNTQQKRLTSKQQAQLLKQGQRRQKKQALLKKDDKKQWKKESETFREALKQVKQEQMPQEEMVKCQRCQQFFNPIFLKKHQEKCKPKPKKPKKK